MASSKEKKARRCNTFIPPDRQNQTKGQFALLVRILSFYSFEQEKQGDLGKTIDLYAGLGFMVHWALKLQHGSRAGERAH